MHFATVAWEFNNWLKMMTNQFHVTEFKVVEGVNHSGFFIYVDNEIFPEFKAEK